MKSIELKDAHGRLQDCAAVIVDNNALVYPSLEDLGKMEENEFLYLSWEMAGKEYSLKFMEQNNQIVKVSDDGALMFLEDMEGDRVQLTLLVPAEIK